MKNASIEQGVWPESNEVLCETRPLDASRLLAWACIAGAVVFGSILIGFALSGSDARPNTSYMLVFVTVHLLGQAAVSAISFRLAARLAAMALVVQLIVAAAILLTDSEHWKNLAFITVPMIFSASALVVERRHSSSIRRITMP